MKNVIIADPTPLVLEGMQNILCKMSNIHIQGAYLSYTSLEEGMAFFIPDLLIFGGELSFSPGLKIKPKAPWKCWPATKTILICSETDPGYIRRSISEGIKSYLLKEVDPPELLKAVESVLEGGIYVQESVRQIVLEQSLGLSKRKSDHLHLTKREIQVIELIVEEYTTQEIAEKLFVSFNTIESHRKNLIIKLGVRNSVGIARQALRLSLYPNFNS